MSNVTGGPQQNGPARWHGKSIGWFAGVSVAVAAIAQPAQLMAQTSNPYADRSVPRGSPLEPGADDARASAQDQRAAASASSAQSATRMEPVAIESRRDPGAADRSDDTARQGSVPAELQQRRLEPAKQSEFEVYAERAIGRKLPRFGADLLVPASRDFQSSPVAQVPPSYVLGPGDQIFVGISGSVEATLDLELDSNGRVFIPKVGAVQLAGVAYGDLQGRLAQAVGQQYRDFRVTTMITRLRGIRVYVTGFARQPGSYTVNSLSTLVNAVLAAGGPGPGGSFRSMRLFRKGQLISDFDLYDLILRGDKSRDMVLENEDVLYVSPVGGQVAVAGSVNVEAIYEAREGESLDRLLAYAGGMTPLADNSRIILYRLSNFDSIGGKEVSQAELATIPVEGGDVLEVLASGTLARPRERQSAVVRIEGEVAKPGNYYVAPGTSLDAVIAMAGGLTSKAFVFGTTVERLSVRQQQRQSFQEALQQLELSISAAPLVNDSSVDIGNRQAQLAAARSALEQLRRREPDGRVVLQLTPDTRQLPEGIPVENSDRIYVPPVPATVGVFGAVYRPASFLLGAGKPKRVRDYLALSGGPIRAADRGELFVVRANGAVLSKRKGALNAYVVPGDVMFVPIRTASSSVWSRILQISTLVFQLGLSAATIAAVSN